MQAESYPGRDLEAMAFAGRYHRWIIDLFAPYLHADAVEIGAGSGNVSALLLERGVHSLVSVEPSPEMFPLLADRAKDEPRIRAHKGTLDSLGLDEKSTGSIVYVNVLEHIEDDLSELKSAHAALRDDGTLLLYVPALPFLYSRFDRCIGHHRRYTRDTLTRVVRGAGFRVEVCRYMDMAGILPWYVLMTLLGRDLRPGSVALYDRVVTPLVRWAEDLVHPPLGKNILLVGRKSSGAASA